MSTPGQRDRPDHRSATRLLLRVSRHGGPWIAVLCLNVAVLTAAEAALPAVLGRTIDTVLGRVPPGHWLLLSALVIAVLVLSDVVDLVGETGATARSASWLRHTTVRHLLSARLPRLDSFAPGDLVTRIVANTVDAGAVGPDVIAGLSSLVLAVAGVVALGLIDPWLCVTFLAGTPVLTLIVVAFAKDASDLMDRYLETQGEIVGRLVEALAGARTIAAAGTTERETRRVLTPLPDLHRYGKGMWRAQGRLTSQDTVVVALLEIAVLGVAGFELSRGRIGPGELFAASQYVLLASTFSTALSSVSRLVRARSAAARVDDVLSLDTVAYGDRALPPGPGRLDFRHVRVRSGGQVLLADLDLVVPGGSLLAVVGRSGSGKSQFARLAGRLLDPDEGEVLLDGVPLPQIERTSLRRAIGYGFERPVLIGATLSDAIAFGTHVPSDQEVLAAARSAHAQDFIDRMPNRMWTPLADAPMSGGEAQRVGLARTFAHADRVIILDDVAASLDTVTEHEISRALTSAMSDLTRILVAHRASTAARSDIVLWLEDGRMRELAPHHELWRDPAYRALFEPAADHSGELAAVASGRTSVA